MIQWLLVTLVELVIATLNGAIGGGASSASRRRRQQRNEEDFFNTGAGSHDSNAPGDKKAKDEAIIDDAYKFFELERPATIEQVKKQYKKLSLRHHPDRNGGSHESQEAMQKVNACLQIIEKDLTGEEDDDGNNAEEDEEHQHKTAQEIRKQYEAMRKQMQKEMAEALKKHQEQKKEFYRQKKKETKNLRKKAKKQNLNSRHGRQVAHEQFQAEQRRVREEAAAAKPYTSTQVPSPEQGTMDGIDDDDDDRNNDIRTNNSATSSTTKPRKPRNPVMDCNTEEKIAALRMGLPDVALELWSGQYENLVNKKIQQAYYAGERQLDLRSVILEFLLQPYDDDGNTLLHYANYYESYNVCAKLYETARNADCLEAILKTTNVHGDSPRVFAEIAQDDGSLLSFYDSQLELTRVRKTQTQLFPTIRAAVSRVYEIVCNTDVGATSATLLSFGVGHYQLKLHVVTTLAGIVLMKTTSNDEYDDDFSYIEDDVAQVTIVIAFYLSWITLRIAFQWLRQAVMIELLLLLAPFVIAGLVGRQQRSRGDGFVGGLIDLILSPLANYLPIVCRYIEPIYGAFVNSMFTPYFLIDHGFLLPYLLVVTELGFLGVGKIYSIVVDPV